MRELKYLSPTAISQWDQDRSEFYLTRLADNRPPRMEQTKPMSIGSAFDAMAKTYIHEQLHGNNGPMVNRVVDGVMTEAPEFDIKTLFKLQVEPQNREWAWENGIHLFTMYRTSGALSTLMLELQLSSEIRMEFEVMGSIPYIGSVAGVPMLGKPDLRFVHPSTRAVISDWKVNGYCAKSMTTPKPGFIRCIDAWSSDYKKHSRNHGDSHPLCQRKTLDGLTYNAAQYLEDIDPGWAEQLTVYAWLLGEEVGGDFIVSIEQLCGVPCENSKPYVRIATHRYMVSPSFQKQLYDKIYHIWCRIEGGPAAIFDDMTPEQSVAKCKELDTVYEAYTTGTPEDEYWARMSRQ